MHMIKEDDIVAFNRIKKCRNDLIYRLYNILVSDGLPKDFIECYTEMVVLIRKIEQWWFENGD